MLINMGFSGVETSLGHLDHAMSEAGFTRWAWDYDHATYDFKYQDKATGTVYYLRVQGQVTEGQDMDHDTIIKLEEPHIGKHLFPHGIDYDAAVPNSITEAAKKKLNEIKPKLS